MVSAPQNQFEFLNQILRKAPDATAWIFGSPSYPDIRGVVYFCQLSNGVLLFVQVSGLPYEQGPCGHRIFGFHIHAGGACTGSSDNPFANAGTHYNPNGCPHPYHAGDLPPLFGNGGLAFQSVFTDRFTVDEIIGRTVIVHISPDDFTTQPSGNSGEEIACGQIY